jgi:hypothetical protein
LRYLSFVVLTGVLIPVLISCGGGGSAGSSSDETSKKPEISAFTASPATISSVQDVTLAWTVSGADTLTIDHNVGTVTGLSSTSVSVTATTTYTLTATNASGSVTATTTVNLNPSGTVSTPVIAPKAGSYTNSVSVVITCDTENADIYYTLDGSAPTSASTKYIGAFSIAPESTGTTTVKAVATKTGMTTSAVASSTYTITITPATGNHIANYTIAKDSVLRAIPDSYITTARTTLHVAYNHTSHGTHVSYGVYGLPGFKAGDATKFGVTVNAAASDPNKLDFQDNQIVGDFYDLSQADADWAAWRNQVRTYLDNTANAKINVMLWSWCDIAGHSVPDYLNSMQTLINEYGPGGAKIGSGAGKTRTTPVTFVFMTGHANGNANTGAGNPREQAKLITDYCTAHGYFCIDYYSIDSHAMNDTYYEDVNDNAESDSYGGNFYQDWQATHTLGVDWYNNRTSPGGTVAYGEHTTQHITSNRKAFAFWWVLARIAGYP